MFSFFSFYFSIFQRIFAKIPTATAKCQSLFASLRLLLAFRDFHQSINRISSSELRVALGLEDIWRWWMRAPLAVMLLWLTHKRSGKTGSDADRTVLLSFSSFEDCRKGIEGCLENLISIISAVVF